MIMTDKRTVTQKVFALLIATLLLPSAASLATTYQYDDAGRLIKVIYDNGMESRYTYDDNGNLVARSTDVINSVDEEALPLATSISPNPTADRLTISVEDADDRPIEITIVALTGETVLSTQRFLRAGECSVDVQHLATGTYQVQVVQGKTSSSTSLVVQR